MTTVSSVCMPPRRDLLLRVAADREHVAPEHRPRRRLTPPWLDERYDDQSRVVDPPESASSTATTATVAAATMTMRWLTAHGAGTEQLRSSGTASICSSSPPRREVMITTAASTQPAGGVRVEVISRARRSCRRSRSRSRCHRGCTTGAPPTRAGRRARRRRTTGRRTRRTAIPEAGRSQGPSPPRRRRPVPFQPCWTFITAMSADATPLTAPTDRSISPSSSTNTTPTEMSPVAARSAASGRRGPPPTGTVVRRWT